MPEKKVPILFKEKKDCCGCGACYSICPVNAIDMKQDEEGFFYPIINKQMCICCHKCVNACLFKKD